MGKLDFITAALRTVKCGVQILKTMTPKKLQILHSSHDLSEEVGELQNAIKRHIFYNQPLDRENVIEEFGDVLANVYKLMHHLEIPEDDIYAAVVEKVAIRYPQGYTDKEALLRADKQ